MPAPQDLIKQVKEHQKWLSKGFTQKYNVNQLVPDEVFEDIDRAKDRKRGRWRQRERKIKLIESKNRQWKDLYDELVRDPSALRASGPQGKKLPEGS